MQKAIAIPKKRHAAEAAEHAVSFLKKNTVMCIAALLAVMTVFLVPPDTRYAGYVDYKTLACLFCTLAVVAALKDIRFFYILAKNIVRLFRNTRACVLALVWITFLGSMLIANDMALLTFLPLSYYVLKDCGRQKTVAFSFVMQTVAANLGGMLTPFGNPQNLYLYTRFNIPTGAFTWTMLPSFCLSVLLITAACLVFVKPEPLTVADEAIRFDKSRSVLYAILFLVSVLMVFRAIPYAAGLLIITVSLLVLDRHAVSSVDYPLLFTFVFFFIFAGNAARLDIVRDTLGTLLNKNVVLFSSLSCQFISNVPSAILLSNFTENWRELLVGVNVGSVGTLISSLASLITFREYTVR
ncbi:MAG: citrate transporter, partial [Clostridia bacterium]|nr:citrate transporter [Clostridia bacterium]